MTITCDAIQEILSALLDQEATREETALCQTHLQTCARCRQTFEELQKTKLLVKSLGHVEAPATLWSRVKNQIEDRKVVFFDFARILRPAMAVAAVIALFFGSVTLLGYFSAQTAAAAELNLYLGSHAYHLMGEPLTDHSSWSIVAGESGFNLVAAEK